MKISAADKERFILLKDNWRCETGLHSNPTLRHQNENYRQILAMGEVAVCLMLRDLLDIENSDWWFYALSELTGVKLIIKKNKRGNFKAIADLWIQWGKGKYL